MDKYDKVMELARRRGFLWPSFEIYGSVAGFWDFGPLGAIMKNKIIERWREYYVIREGFFEIDCPTVMPAAVLKASGHVNHFLDIMATCKKCKAVFKIADVIKEQTNLHVEGKPIEKIKKIIQEKNVRCPNCGGTFGKIGSQNLMFQTSIGPYSERTAYLRPETAQGIFIDFRRLLQHARDKLPFGVVMLGKGYRNEISPRQGVIRLREFTMAEAEIFIDPNKLDHFPRFDQVKNEKLQLYPATEQLEGSETQKMTAADAVSNGTICNKYLAYYMILTKQFLQDLGIPKKAIRFRQQIPGELAHYSVETWDSEIKTARFGWVEVAGHAYRTDYDLKRHTDMSDQDLSAFVKYDQPKTIEKTIIEPNMAKLGPKLKEKTEEITTLLTNTPPEKIQKSFDKQGYYKIHGFKITPKDVTIKKKKEKLSGEKITPHVIEPSYGIDRPLYCILEYAYTEEEDRTYLKIKPNLTPIETAIFPLVAKKDLQQKAKKIHHLLTDHAFLVEYDDTGSIGRRYARMDEIGCPFCITIDRQTLKDDTVTLRNRDNRQQVRIPTKKIPETLRKLLLNKLRFADAGKLVKT